MKKSFQFLNFNLLMLMVIFFGITAQVQSQSMIFEKAPERIDQISEKTMLKYEYFKSLNPEFEPIFVTINALEKSLDDGKITIALEESNCGVVSYQVNGAEYESESEYYWSGRIVDYASDDCALGEMLMTKNDNLFRANFSMGLESYTIEPLDLNGNYLLIKAPADDFFSCGNTGKEVLETPEIDFNLEEKVTPDCNIRVLILGTESVWDKVTNFQTWGPGRLTAMNQGMINSHIWPSQGKFVLAAIESTDGYFDETDLTTTQAHNQIRSNGTAIARRNAVNADVVLTFVDPDIMDDSDGVGGRADFGGRWATADQVFFQPDIRTSHELGHLLRGHHERCGLTGSTTNCNAGGGAAHAHFGTNFRTRIFGNTNTNGALNHFSNPNTSSGGNTLGVTGAADNASVMRPRGCIAAMWNTAGNTPYSVTINGSNTVCQNTPTSGNFSANVNGTNVGTLSYSWALSTNGVNYSSIPGSSSYVFVVFPSGSNFFILRCTVVSSNYGTYTTYKYLHIINCGGGWGWAPEPGNDFERSALPVNSVLTYPNPSDGEITFQIVSQGTQGPGEIRIMDMTGKFIRNIPYDELSKGANVITEQLTGLANGTYFYTLNLDGNPQRGTFVVIR